MKAQPVNQIRDGRLLVLCFALVILAIVDLSGNFQAIFPETQKVKFSYQLVQDAKNTRLVLTSLVADEQRQGSRQGIPDEFALFYFAAININTATREILLSIPGIGPGLAGKIVRRRQAEGPFLTIEDLRKIPGVGEKRALVLRDRIHFGPI